VAAELQDERLRADCTLQLGQVALVEGRLDEADALLRESAAVLSSIGLLDREAIALQSLARLYLRQARIDDAEAALRQSMAAVRQFALARHSIPMLEALAAIAADRGDHVRAARLAGAAEGLLARVGARAPSTAPMRTALVARWRASLAAPGADQAFAD